MVRDLFFFLYTFVSRLCSGFLLVTAMTGRPPDGKQPKQLPPVPTWTKARLTPATTGTACWPCRQRKVKCDNQQPCENCVKREHPQLCSYKPNRSNTSKSGSIDAGSSHGTKRPHSPEDSEDYDNDNDRQPQGWPRAAGKPSPCGTRRSALTRFYRSVGNDGNPSLHRPE
jgi:hypothetical protein